MAGLVDRVTEEIRENYKKFQVIVIASYLIVGVIVTVYVIKGVLKKEVENV